jgi:hypothetical protein
VKAFWPARVLDGKEKELIYGDSYSDLIAREKHCEIQIKLALARERDKGEN